MKKLIGDETRFYLGFEQVKADIEEMTDRIYESINDGLLPRDTRISLWGFSIGGLGVLGAFFEQPEKYHGCMLIHSGANFETLGYNKDLLTEEQWRGLRDKMLALPLNSPVMHGRVPSIRREEFNLFKMLFLGQDPDRLRELTSEHSNKLLLFVGGADEVAPLESVVSSLVPKAGLAIHVLPGLRHDNVHKQFRYWIKYEAKVIKAFLDYHPTN